MTPMASKKAARKTTKKPTKKPRRASAPTPPIERVEVEIPPHGGRAISADDLKKCGEALSRVAGGRPVVFTFKDRVVAIATSMIEKGRAQPGTSPKRRVPTTMQAEWLDKGVDLQRAVDRARAITQLKASKEALMKKHLFLDAHFVQQAIDAERRGVDTRSWNLPLVPV